MCLLARVTCRGRGCNRGCTHRHERLVERFEHHGVRSLAVSTCLRGAHRHSAPLRATGSRHMPISAALEKIFRRSSLVFSSRAGSAPGFQDRMGIWSEKVPNLDCRTTSRRQPVLSCASFRVRPALRPARVTRGVARNLQRPRLRAESSSASPRRSTQGSGLVASTMASTLARLSKYAKGENTTSVFSHAKVRRALSLTLHADSRRAR